jgi:hypothetical protein
MPITSFAGVAGAARTAAELHALIEKIDLLVLNLLNEEGYDAGATYRLGDREVGRTEYLDWLRKMREDYVRELSRLPVWEPTTVRTP